MITLPVHAAEWSIAPRARLAVDYTDNPLLAPAGNLNFKGGATDLSADTTAELANHGDRLDLTIDPRLMFVRFLDDPILDQDNEYLNVNSQYQWDELTTFTAGVNGARDTTLASELGITGLTQTNRRHEGLAINAGPSFQLTERLNLGTQASYSANHYADATGTGLLDYQYRSVDIKPVYSLSELTQVSLDTSLGQLEVPAEHSRTTSLGSELTLTRQFSHSWSGTLAGGASRVRSDVGQEMGFVYEADLQWQGELTNVLAKVSRTVTPTGRGVLTRLDQAQLTVSRPLSERWTLSFSGLLNRNRDLLAANAQGSGSYTVNYYSLETDLQWRMTETWNLLFSVQDQHNESSALNANMPIARSYRGTIGLIWTGRPSRIP